MLLSILLASPFFVSPVASQLSAYTSWTPEYTRYCEQIQSTNPTTPLSGGVACGYTAWNVMSNLYPLKIASTSTLSLINVGWITTEALSSQKGFWKTCKPYMIRLFDGLWSDLSKACTLLVNQPSGFPNCTQDYTGSFLYRSGSGYCMNSKVCGANTEIEFYKNADGSSLLYSWEPADAARFTALGYTKVGSCYGYGKLANSGSTTTNLENEPPFF
ncbi:unnamed protein product [Caenorhabditis nigoni]